MSKSLILRLLLAAIVLLTLAGCVKKRDPRRPGDIRGRSVEQVFDSHRDTLLSIPGVIGAGIAKIGDRPVIVVMVKERNPEIDSRIPKTLDGYSVVLNITSQFYIPGP